jgi:predicted AAA+ superfamily ATPase
MKKFKVAGACVPAKHYMVDISAKIEQIKKLIDNGEYFTINRARQYGKTTTLYELRRRLSKEYTVIQISFEGLGSEDFSSPENFCPIFIRHIVKALKSPAIIVEQNYIEKLF